MIKISKVRKDFYVYEWFNVDTGEVFYVGKGTKGRWRDVKDRNQYFINYHNKYNCDVRKVYNKLEEKDAFDLEVKFIEKYKKLGQCKCNLTDGGEGATFEEGGWDFYYQKLVALYNSQFSSLELMPNANSYYHKDLKVKTVEELKDMYQDYIDFKNSLDKSDYSDWEEMLESKGIYSGRRKPFRKKSMEELVRLYELIPAETRSYTSAICNANPKFREFSKCVSFLDYMRIDTEIIEEILDTVMESPKYMESLFESLMGALWHMRFLGRLKRPYEELSFIPSIKTFGLTDENTIQIRFALDDMSGVKTTHIDMRDLVLGLITSKDKTLLELIVDEMLVSPILF